MDYLHAPENPNGHALLLTHGAGSNANAPLLIEVAESLCAAGFLVQRYTLPFRKKRPSGGPHPSGAAEDRAGLKNAAAELRTQIKGKLIIGGHSYGGRQATMLAAEQTETADALLLLSYPLHPPGQPAKLRTAHFPDLRTPALFIHGTKDEFGTSEEMRAALVLIPANTELVLAEGAGHDLKKGRNQISQAILQSSLFGRLLNGK